MVTKALAFIKEKTGTKEFDVAVLGGSGIKLDKIFTEIPYSQIPQMPIPSVPGHSGTLKILEVGKKKVLFFEGRFHYYEDREDWELRFIPELSAKLGVKLFISTCASGAISRKAAQSEIGVIVDHINLLGRNPLVGLIKSYGDKVFINGKEIYDRKVSDLFLRKGIELGLSISPVVLASVLGPNYETFAEIRFLEVAGADVVSMSSIPEILSAKFYSMRVAALTVITNDTLKLQTTHEEVLNISSQRSKKLSRLLWETIHSLKLS
ncbi:purine-nucleoside phosphorylase [Desulfurobacterium thermolithotrophum]|uniref:purine-nucleoside phosphorylase n=1 Tax=Desulfurobacterium thermolithotrophum TaxID=64160 RepID=UPI0013D06B95